MRLDKFMVQMGIGSRTEVKNLIKKGQISVNGQIVKQSELKINENTDIVCVQGKEVNYQKFFYYMLHKPQGVVTATVDQHDMTVMDLMKEVYRKDLFPVGRLDKDTEGLLLITNDGELSHTLLSPKKHVEKTYFVRCHGEINEEKISLLEHGVDIGDDKITLPAKVQVLEQNETEYCMHLTITEGRFHQVKRMVKAVGGEVTYLKRISFGTLFLGNDLEIGSYRELTIEEINRLKHREQ